VATLINIAYLGFPYSTSSHPWYSANNAFDGTDETWWEAGNPCSYGRQADLQYRWTDKSFKVIRYRLLMDAARRPIDWKLQGSDDGILWDDLDEQTAQTSDRTRWETYDINNDRYFSYYRLLITAGASYDQAVRVFEFNLMVDETSTTTLSTTTSESTTTESTTTTESSSTQTTTTLSSSTQTTGSTQVTSTFTSFSTTAPPPGAVLWPADSKLDGVRDNFNEWYDKGIPLGVKQLDALPPFEPAYEGNIVYLRPKSKYYLATDTAWEELNLGNVPHAAQHGTGQPDEIVHIGPTPPGAPFVGELWFDVPEAPSTTTTTVTTTTTTPAPTTETTGTSGSSTETTTLSTSTSTTYTFTSTTLTSTTQSTTLTTTITQLFYPTNVAEGASTGADSFEIGYEPSKAIDLSVQTKWLTNHYQGTFPHWIELTLVRSSAVHSYGILWDPARYAYRWILEASNNRLIWNQLDFRDAQSPFLDQWNYYFFNNRQIYRYYRFRFLTGNDGRHYSLGIYGLEMYAGGQEETTTLTSTTETTTTQTTTYSTTLTTITQLGYQNVAPWAITLASDEYPSYLVSNVVDDNEASYWICDPYSGPPYWIEFYWTDERHYAVDYYRFYSTTLGRPKSWKLQGSQGEGTWVDLDIRTNMDVEGWFEAVISNVTQYSHYRFFITETHSVGYSVRVGMIELWVNQAYRSTTTTETSTSESTTGTTDSTTETSSTESTVTTLSSTLTSTTQPIPIEPKLILNFDGQEGSYQPVDDTRRHENIMWSGSAHITTAKSKFGPSSLTLTYPQYYPTNALADSYLEIPNSADWRLGDGHGNFTIDFWMLMVRNQNLWRNWNTVIACVDSVDTYWALRYYPEGEILDFTFRLNGEIKISYFSQLRLIENQFNHIALTRIGNRFKAYQQGIACNVGQIVDVTFPYPTGPIWIGKGPSEHLNTNRDFSPAVFWLDGLRLTTGALYQANFTPPGEPTTSTTLSTTSESSTTSIPLAYEPRLIFRCDDGGNYLYDASGRHGVASVPGTGTTFIGQFITSPNIHVDPAFGTTLFSSSTYPLDWSNTEAGYITMANHSDWWLGDDGIDDFTVEMWIAYKQRNYTIGTPLLSQYQNEQNFWAIYCDYLNRKFYFKVRVAGSFLVHYETDINYNNFAWNYFAFVRRDGQFNLYWHGNGSSLWEDYSSVTIPALVGELRIFGGPSLTNYLQIVPSEVACSGVRLSRGVVPGVTEGHVPSAPF
jgi:hypothetical protein